MTADAMPDATPDATLVAWRAAGADRVSPMRFRRIESLARRAQAYDGDVRRLLDERLAVLIAAYGDEVARAAAQDMSSAATQCNDAVIPVDVATRDDKATRDDEATRDTTATPDTLASLVALLLSRAPTTTPPTDANTRDAQRHLQRSPDLPMLDYFRATWSKVSAEKQLRQSFERVPDNAGPLNSNSLVHRSLSLMRELSPGYLQQFLSYVDALSWMEQVAGPVASNPAARATEAPRAEATKKSTSARNRSR